MLALVACVLGPIRSASAQPADLPPEPEPAPTPEPVPAPDPAPSAPGPWLDVVPAVPEVAPTPEPAAASPLVLRTLQIHGFVSQGAFLSTANDYIGRSSRGSLEMTEVGLNVSTEVADRLRAGVQLFSREVGIYHDLSPRIDWAFLDYKLRPWLGLRAGIIKMPFGLYNEYADIDSARLPVLMPQGIYPVRNREALLAHRGFAVYGEHTIGGAGSVEYQAWLGTLSIPENALTLGGATLDSIDTKYVTGAQVFWHPPIEGLKVGGSWLRASIDFNLTLSPENIAGVVMAGLAPPDYNGALVVSQRPTTFVVGSAELLRGRWQLAAEYSRSFARQRSSLPSLLPTTETDREGFYALVGYQLSTRFAVGAYYSVDNLDAADRKGHDPKYAENYQAYQRDAAATVRFDVNDHWLWKLEAHVIDGAADLTAATNPNPDQWWGMFLLETTVTF